MRDPVDPARTGHLHEIAERFPGTLSLFRADLMEPGSFDESHWNGTSNERHQPYSCSKTRAERLAWQIASRQDRWDLVVVNPGLVFGPALSPHTSSESVRIMRDFGTGYYCMGVPGLEFGIVDVRDVAEGHVRAALTPGASGRHILVSESLTLGEIAGVLREHFGRSFPFPRFKVPRIFAVLLAPLRGISRTMVRRSLLRARSPRAPHGEPPVPQSARQGS